MGKRMRLSMCDTLISYTTGIWNHRPGIIKSGWWLQRTWGIMIFNNCWMTLKVNSLRECGNSLPPLRYHRVTRWRNTRMILTERDWGSRKSLEQRRRKLWNWLQAMCLLMISYLNNKSHPKRDSFPIIITTSQKFKSLKKYPSQIKKNSFRILFSPSFRKRIINISQFSQWKSSKAL